MPPSAFRKYVSVLAAVRFRAAVRFQETRQRHDATSFCTPDAGGIGVGHRIAPHMQQGLPTVWLAPSVHQLVINTIAWRACGPNTQWGLLFGAQPVQNVSPTLEKRACF